MRKDKVEIGNSGEKELEEDEDEGDDEEDESKDEDEEDLEKQYRKMKAKVKKKKAKKRSDPNAAMWSYRTFRRANPTLGTRQGVELIGFRMVKKGDYRGAIELLKANAADYPHSASAQFGIGRAYQAAGDKENARRNAQERRNGRPGPGLRPSVYQRASPPGPLVLLLPQALSGQMRSCALWTPICIQLIERRRRP